MSMPPIDITVGPGPFLMGLPSPALTLRDYFAGQALSRCIEYATSITISGGSEKGETVYRTSAVSVAKLSYLIADAMLAERGKA